MDFLNRAFAQLSDLFRSMTPAARITTGLLLVVVVVSLGYLFNYQVSGADCDLMNGEPIPPGYFAKMEAAFGEAGLNQHEYRGPHILVPRSQKATYMAALADADALPPNFGDAMRKAVDSGSRFGDRRQWELREKVALQDELALTITKLTGAQSASVLYATETKGSLNRETVSKATVAVELPGSQGLDPKHVSMIRYMVAMPIPGLKPENVVVADNTGLRSRGGDSDDGAAMGETDYVYLKRMHEQDWRNKILDALAARIPGVQVAVNVVLDEERINRISTVTYEQKPVVIRETTEGTSSTREAGGPGGRPGLQSQAANAATSLALSQSSGSQEDSEERRETVSAPNTEHTEREMEGLTPERVSVAVDIPSSHFEKVWRQKNPTEDGQEPQTPDQAALRTIETEETTKVQKLVAALLPPVEGVDDLTQLVTVATFADFPPEEIPGPGVADKAMVWFGQHWGTLGIVGLALLSLLMLRSMIRAVPAAAGPAPATAAAAKSMPAQTEQEEDESTPAVVARRLARFSGSGPSLRDELSELVQEDSDAAANILRTWIDTAN